MKCGAFAHRKDSTANRRLILSDVFSSRRPGVVYRWPRRRFVRTAMTVGATTYCTAMTALVVPSEVLPANLLVPVAVAIVPAPESAVVLL